MLRARQKKFLALYIDGPDAGNAKKCALEAGYKEGSVAALMRSQQVQDEIASRSLALQVRYQISGDNLRDFHAGIVWDPRSEDNGGPSRSERQESARELARLLHLHEPSAVLVGVSLADMLAMARQKEALLPPPEVPERLRLVQGNKT